MARRSPFSKLDKLEQLNRLAVEKAEEMSQYAAQAQALREELGFENEPRKLLQRRDRFLKLIEELAPEVMEGLKRCADAPTQEEEDQAFEDWTEKYGLKARWIFEAAFSTVDAMRHDPTVASFSMRLAIVGKKGEIVAPFGKLVPYSPSTMVVIPPMKSWRRSLETRAEAESRLKDEAEACIQRHLDEVDRATGEETGAIDHRGGDPERHLRWLIRWQCQRWPKGRIAREELVVHQTVVGGLESAAAEMNIKLRAPHAGRPARDRENLG